MATREAKIVITYETVSKGALDDLREAGKLMSEFEKAQKRVRDNGAAIARQSGMGAPSGGGGGGGGGGGSASGSWSGGGSASGPFRRHDAHVADFKHEQAALRRAEREVRRANAGGQRDAHIADFKHEQAEKKRAEREARQANAGGQRAAHVEDFKHEQAEKKRAEREARRANSGGQRDAHIEDFKHELAEKKRAEREAERAARRANSGGQRDDHVDAFKHEQAEKKRAEREAARANSGGQRDDHVDAFKREQAEKKRAEREAAREAARANRGGQRDDHVDAFKHHQAEKKKEAKKAEQEEKEARRTSFVNRPFSRFQDSLQNRGMSAGGIAARGAAVVGALTYGTQAITNFGNAGQNENLSQSQRNIAMMDSLTLGLTRIIRNFGDMLSGLTERLRAQQLRFQRQSGASALRHASGMRVASYEQQIDQSEAGREAFVRNPYAAFVPNQFNRDTAQGRQQYGEYSALYEARMRNADARRAVGTSQEALTSQEQRVQQSQQRLAMANTASIEARSSYQREFSRPTNGRNIYALRNAAQLQDQAVLEQQRAAQAHEQQLAVLMQRRLQLANDIGRSRETEVAIMRTQLQIEQNRTTQMEGVAGRVGGMNRGTQMAAESAAAHARTQGLSQMSDEFRELARRWDPDLVSRLERQEGENVIARTRQTGTAPSDSFNFANGNTIAQQRGREEQLRFNITNTLNVNGDELARRISDAMTPSLRSLIETLRTQLQAEITGLTTQQQLQAANQNPG